MQPLFLYALCMSRKRIMHKSEVPLLKFPILVSDVEKELKEITIKQNVDSKKMQKQRVKGGNSWYIM